MTEYWFLILSMIANVLAYGGCIVQNKDNRRAWVVIANCGRALGVIGLFLILIYLSV